MPGLRPGLVPRPRLAQPLDEGWGRGLVLVCAPAGYGKTVLLADWVRRGREPVAWLVTGVGLGLLFVPLSLVALNRIPARDAGLASSLLNTGQQVGGAIGLAALGTVA